MADEELNENVDQNIENENTDINDEQNEESQNLENEELSLTFDGEESEETEEELEKKDPSWLKNLRKKEREQRKRIKELEKQVASKNEELPKIGPKPKLDDADIDYDTEKYDNALTKWFEDKKKVEEEESKREATVKSQQEAFNQKLSLYNEAKTKLPVKNFNEIEEEVTSILSIAQQSVIVKVADDPAKLVYALGKNVKTLQKAASFNDLIDFTAFISKLETKLKTSSAKTPVTLPEKVITGSGKPASTFDKELEKLRTEAEKTGDLSKLNAYKRKLKKSK